MTESAKRCRIVRSTVAGFCCAVMGVFSFSVAMAQSTEGIPASVTSPDASIAGANDSPETTQALQSLMALDAGDGLNQQLRKLALQHLPEVYVDDRKWNRSETIKTLIPRSEPLIMKHGTWSKYELRPVDPANTFAVRLTNVRNLDDGRLAFNLACDLTVDLEARQAKWHRGVQLYSLQADISTRLTMELDCCLGLKLDFADGSAVVLAPHVESAQIAIHEFRIHRISKVGGEIAQQATRAARKWLEEHATEHETKLASSINTQLQKKPEKLRISLSK
ncbi:MAG: hypothetical protein JNL67_07855 [Planctomycetaceae bacterium]|nr:hypothetical protein [Planctomycetaceae bacterium]